MIALARKYRPKQFSDLIVQDHVAAALRGAVGQGRVAHGYLFAGPRGTGKTTAARILAMALNCANRTPAGEPCGECESCRRIWTGAANLDVVELDAASNRGVDDARDLRERAMYAASTEAGSKVYIVDEDSRGAAGARRIRLRDDRAAEDCQYGGADPVPTPAIRFPPDRAARDREPAERRRDGRAADSRG